MNAKPQLAYFVVFVLVAGGLAAGYFLPIANDAPVRSTPAVVDNQPGSLGTQKPDIGAACCEHRVEFALTPRDVRDQIQAPQIASDGNNRIWLAWDSRTGDKEQSLYLCQSSDGGLTFGEPTLIRKVAVHEWQVMSRGQSSKRESRLWPRMSFVNDALYLCWGQPKEDDVTTLQLFHAKSTDWGVTFSEPKRLTTDAAVRPTFVAFSAHQDGRVAASWLDNRNRAQQPFATMVRETDGQMDELVFAGQEEKGICPCCNTANLLTDDGGIVVAFRNHHNGFRDIWFSVRRDGEAAFSIPFSVAGDRWKFDGCPHDGPAMVIRDGIVHIVWMDASTGTPKVYYARSEFGDSLFKSDGTVKELSFKVDPIDSTSDGVQGHPSIAVAQDGTVHVVWDESLDTASELAKSSNERSDSRHVGHGATSGSGRAICHAVIPNGSATFGSARKISPKAGAFQSRPSVIPMANGVVGFAWNELTEQGKSVVWYLNDSPQTSLAKSQ